jgi:hypothetical protein
MTLAEDFALRLDPALRMRRLGRVADPWQQTVLRSKAKRRALLAARQVGKGETLTCIGLEVATSKDDAVVGVLAPGMRQSCRLLRRIRRALPLVAPHIEATNNAVETLMLSNGSEIVAWPGNNADAIRGDTLDALLADEAAWIDEAAFTATLPMLAMTDGIAVLASTPGGPEGFLFDIFNDVDDKAAGWERTLITADDCPRYTEEMKAELRRALGETAYATEMLCHWRDGVDALFTREELDRIFGIEPDPDDADLPDDDYVPLPRLQLATSFADL